MVERNPAQATTQLQREIEQSRPFPTIYHASVVGLLRTADLVRARFEEFFEPYGITPQQYNVLRILRGARPDPVPTMTIARRMIERAPGITRLLDRLEVKGLVQRERCADDRRRVLCTISEKGLRLLAELDEPFDRLEAGALGMLSEPGAGRLVGLLDQIRAARE